MGLAETLAEKYLRAAGADGELGLHGCCSYEATWHPGIKEWGATDEESFNLAEIRVPLCRAMIIAALNEALELAAQEAEKERLTDDTGEKSDEAYNTAIEHATAAI